MIFYFQQTSTGNPSRERDQPHQRAAPRDERHGTPGQRVLRDLQRAQSGCHQPGQHPQAGPQTMPEQVHSVAKVLHRKQGDLIITTAINYTMNK